MAMKKECDSAAFWWANQLNTSAAPLLSQEQISSFQRVLAEILESKYLNHWYPDEPERGSAFRSIINDNRTVDQVLLEAASKAKISNLKSRLNAEAIMWVDPHQIQVQFSHSPRRHLIYGNPISNDSMFDPTILRGAAVFNTHMSGSGSSSTSLSPQRTGSLLSRSFILDEQNRHAQTVNM